MQHVKDMISKLVSFDTVSSKSNLPILDYIEAYLAEYGVESHRVYNAEGDKANLYATIGPKVAGGVVLSGHTDVVPVDNQDWSTDPFDVIEKDGKLYGRGTADMKSYSAINLALVPDMIKADLKRPIHLALSYDEEVGCLGAPSMIDEMVKTLPPVHAVIVGEPTNMQIANMHKGMNAGRVYVRGLEAHSSQPHLGCSANLYAARLMVEIGKISDELKENKLEGIDLEPNYSTLNMGIVQGGIAANIIARDCMFSWDYRNLPDDDVSIVLNRIYDYANKLEAEMKAIYSEASIRIELLQVTGLKPEHGGAAETLVRELSGRNSVMAVPYGTEAGQFQERGYSTVICGPGSIDQAHKPDEFITLDQVQKGLAFTQRLIAKQAQ
ncbi:acetylornithine deacetylase [Cohaesibacter gelatinilyticus]|uniref:Acetylornithine deacetylase n=1 Tax=Cohaesibacter gelatinilyticus TaxID=372072 RepID=A0A285NEE8_9HYPH|nr:acetylornithine deacetylase [Cohaesibacter gelatinilyticus]SNZ07884.1 acetylornithine deacetylase [Cohaesibacter gelatinilyticus]